MEQYSKLTLKDNGKDFILKLDDKELKHGVYKIELSKEGNRKVYQLKLEMYVTVEDIDIENKAKLK